MEVVKALLRAVSYLFHGLLALFLIAVAAMALTSGSSLHLEMLPWTGHTLAYVLLFGALFGLLTVLLAITGKLRPLFFLWSLVVLVLMLKGYIFSGYHFEGGIKTASYLVVGAILSLFGAWSQMRTTRRGATRRY